MQIRAKQVNDRPNIYNQTVISEELGIQHGTPYNFSRFSKSVRQYRYNQNIKTFVIPQENSTSK